MKIFSNEEMQKPMRKVVKRVEELGVDLKKYDGLEFYAREGDWQTVSYSDQLASLHAWEIDPEREKALRRNLPNAQIRIGNSYELACLPEYQKKFNFINFDNPQATFGCNNEYCEHFEALPLIENLIPDQGIVVFDVNYNPYNYKYNNVWRKRRDSFYKKTDTSRLSFEFIKSHYEDYFLKMGFVNKFSFIEDRHDGHFAYCVMKLNRK